MTQEFKVGGKITLEDNISYRIVDIIKEREEEFYFCCTVEKPIVPKVLLKKEVDGEVFMTEIEEPKILEKIALKILK